MYRTTTSSTFLSLASRQKSGGGVFAISPNPKRWFTAENQQVPGASAAALRNHELRQHPGRKWGKRVVGFSILWLSLYVGDAALNDDLDSIVNRFRPRLPYVEQKKRPKVVILGAGWGALSMLQKLKTDEFQVTIVANRNYFLFTPLLASTCVGTLQQRSIVEPIRQFCNRSDAHEAKFIEAECTNIDFQNNSIHCVDNSAVQGEVNEFDLKYDHLIVAVGCEPATFNIKGVQENAVFMKEIKHSVTIRDRILDSLETAGIPGQSEEEINRLLHFVVVGGGPSGVEFSAELHDFLVSDVEKLYPEYADRVKISLVEALPHVLTMFDATLINHTEKVFARNKINLELNSSVQEVKPKSMTVKSKSGELKEIPYGVLVWVTGNATRTIIKNAIASIGVEIQTDRRGLKVDKHFRVLGVKNVWAIGDCAVSGFVPTAQVAAQEGTYLGRLFNSFSNEMFLAKKGEITLDALHNLISDSSAFSYRHFGSFAYIGDREAIAEVSTQDRKNYTAYGNATFFLWRSVYFSKLLSYKNRWSVLSDWLNTALFGRNISRA